MTRPWRVAEPAAEDIRRIVEATGVSPLLATLMANRKIDSDIAAQFLAPQLRDLPSPFGMHGMAEAAKRLVEAVRKRERIAVYGDYDVDGVTSVSLLHLFLAEIGHPVDYLIPDRFAHGYGFHVDHVAELKERGIDLLVTVDCGICDVAAVRAAREAGMDVVIVDHHKPPDELPPANAIINPLQPSCDFEFSAFAACGLTFHLLVALRYALREDGFFRSRSEPDLREYLDIAALGTIADMVPLVAENRRLAWVGLQALARSQRPGLAALRESAQLRPGTFSSDDVAFQLAPRLNAAGRMGSAERAVALLTTSDPAQARELAAELEQENRRRKRLEKNAFAAAARRVDEQDGGRDAAALVLASQDWHPGVTGIVAARMAERFDRPVVLIAFDGPLGRGSARGVDGLDLHALLGRCAEHLEVYGGHAAAAGVTIHEERLEAFREQFVREVGEARLHAKPTPLEIDAELPFEGIDRRLVAELQKLAPFGQGNREPTFVTRRVRVDGARVVGGSHLQLSLSQDGTRHDGIAFGMGHAAPPPGALIDVVHVPHIDGWRGANRLRLRISDLNMTG